MPLAITRRILWQAQVMCTHKKNFEFVLMPKIKQQKLKNIDSKVGGEFYIFMLNHLETHQL